MDVIDFKRKNWIKENEALIMAVALGEGREGMPQVVTTSALDECVEIALKQNPGLIMGEFTLKMAGKDVIIAMSSFLE